MSQLFVSVSIIANLVVLIILIKIIVLNYKNIVNELFDSISNNIEDQYESEIILRNLKESIVIISYNTEPEKVNSSNVARVNINGNANGYNVKYANDMFLSYFKNQLKDIMNQQTNS